MSKVAQQYLDIDPWLVREGGFHPERSKVSESIFSLANEFMGVRGYFEEGYGGERMVGSFFNGVFEEENLSQMPAFSFRGMIDRSHGIANAVDWLHTRISVDGEALDLASSEFSDFERVLNMRSGLMTRSFVWQTRGGARLRVRFERLLSIRDGSLGFQRIAVESLSGRCSVCMRLGLDFDIPQYTQRMAQQWECLRKQVDVQGLAILGRITHSGHCVFSSARFDGCGGAERAHIQEERYVGVELNFVLEDGETRQIDRTVVNHVRRDPPVDVDAMWSVGMAAAAEKGERSFDAELADNTASWQAIWEHLDVEIEGDAPNQQGIRYCLFQLYQSYRGIDPTLNVTAKGLTSEYYYGWTWWDTETYCLPFYMFNNPAGILVIQCRPESVS